VLTSLGARSFLCLLYHHSEPHEFRSIHFVNGGPSSSLIAHLDKPKTFRLTGVPICDDARIGDFTECRKRLNQMLILNITVQLSNEEFHLKKRVIKRGGIRPH
jgi:hypothetical protein